jgi:hypothetical protein
MYYLVQAKPVAVASVAVASVAVAYIIAWFGRFRAQAN